jgi:hypothetical protein
MQGGLNVNGEDPFLSPPFSAAPISVVEDGALPEAIDLSDVLLPDVLTDTTTTTPALVTPAFAAMATATPIHPTHATALSAFGHAIDLDVDHRPASTNATSVPTLLQLRQQQSAAKKADLSVRDGLARKMHLMHPTVTLSSCYPSS